MAVDGCKGTHVLNQREHQAKHVNSNLGPRATCHIIPLVINENNFVLIRKTPRCAHQCVAIVGSVVFDSSQLLRGEVLARQWGQAETHILED